MYEQIAQATNGNISGDFNLQDNKWIPTLNGSGTSGTFTYTNQTGWVLRKGILVDVWFDITWTGVGTAAGNIFLDLPYKVAVSNAKPFVGVVQESSIVYTGGTGIVINSIPNTYRGEFWNVGSGFATANQAVTATGQLIGHLRYLGQANETA